MSQTPKRDGKAFWETDEHGEPVLQKHHIIPSSRGGEKSEENLLTEVPSDIHWAWHRLCGNRTPLEILDTILKVWFRSGRFIKYRTSIKRRTKEKEAEPPKTMTPDQIIIALMERVFPEDWVPSKRLIKRLEKRRERSVKMSKPER
jgi:hypothetical protein